MKWLVRLIDRFETWYRSKRHEYDREAHGALAGEAVGIQSRERGANGKQLAIQLRRSGSIYSLANNAWLENNPTKEMSDFDTLPFAIKETWMNQVQNA